MKKLLVWLQEEEGWKSLLALVYAIICLFDFVIVPSWIGITRGLFDEVISVEMLSKLDSTAQLKYLEISNYQHEPFTLKGGGLFHLAFGALLTGSAIRGRIGK